MTSQRIGEQVARAIPAGPDLQRRRADSAARAYAIIRRMVVDFRLRPNERLNEVQMARDLTLSRTPVREALQRLATEGFLSFVPNRGYFFRSPNITELVQIYEARAVLEKGAFGLACERLKPADLRALEQFWAHAVIEYRQRDPDRILELDETFHLKLAALSGNQELVRQLDGINARIRFVRRVQIERGPRHESMVGAHDELLEAARARDTARGQAILSSHIWMSIDDAADVLKEAVFKAFVGSDTPSAAEGRNVRKPVDTFA